jgi:dipeptidyl aminopeptidase/acylaminoacyl peptidase
MSIRTTLRIIAAVLCITTAAPVHAQPTPVTLTDLLRIRTVSSIHVARDGTRAVYAVQSIAVNDEDPAILRTVDDLDPGAVAEASFGYRSHLFLLDLTENNALPVQLTWGDTNDASPRLSPNGQTIAFVRAVNGVPQIWLLSNGGGEARCISSLEYGASRPRWSPDGRSLLVQSDVLDRALEERPDWPSERPGRAYRDAPGVDGPPADPDGSLPQQRAWLARNAAGSAPMVFNERDFQMESSLRDELTYTHLYIVSIDAPAAPRRLTRGHRDHLDGTFMPDGRHVIYARKRASDQHPDVVREWELRSVTVDGSTDTLLYAQDGMALQQPRPDRSGTMVAFLARPADPMSYRNAQLGMVSLANDPAEREPIWLTDAQSYEDAIWDPRWHADRAGVLFRSARQGSISMMMMAPGVLEPVELASEIDGHPMQVTQWDVAGGMIVYAAATAENPCQLRIAHASDDRQVVDLNPWIAQRVLSRPREGWMSRPDGTRVQYWTMPPVNREAGRTYPLVVHIHGGPAWMWGPGSASMWHEWQYMCARGYGVVFCNPRGSMGYGAAFQRAIFQDWGGGPGGDVLAAADQASLLEWVDNQRLYITGGSYGGYLTAWILTQDQRFKAAVAQRGVYDFNTFFGEGLAYWMLQREMGGWPWNARVKDVYDRESPFNAVQRIRTPLLILHAVNDERVGLSQPKMMYRALKVMDRPVELVLYPDSDHGLSRHGDPVLRMDRVLRIVEFFARFP